MGYLSRSFEFWLLNIVLWGLVLYSLKCLNRRVPLVEWFGRHAMWIYVIHWVFLGLWGI